MKLTLLHPPLALLTTFFRETVPLNKTCALTFINLGLKYTSDILGWGLNSRKDAQRLEGIGNISKPIL